MRIPDLFRELRCCIRAAARFRGYQPQAITPVTTWQWLQQFKTPLDRRYAVQSLERVIYLDERRVKNSLVELNRSLVERLLSQGLSYEKIVYVQIDDAGSSSPVILNILKNLGHIQQRGCPCFDGKDIRGINDKTNELEEGAIIYVDDFIGSGDQFKQCRDAIKEFIFGNFSEFVLATCICEEGIGAISREGVEPVTDLVHAKADRPLHSHCVGFGRHARERMVSLANEVSDGDYYQGLGYKRLSTSVVIYLNSPDTTPVLLRGVKMQEHFKGIFPRYSDLPPQEYAGEPRD